MVVVKPPWSVMETKRISLTPSNTTQDNLYFNQFSRFNSFGQDWNTNYPPHLSALTLSRYGFYLLFPKDLIKCAFCSKKVSLNILQYLLPITNLYVKLISRFISIHSVSYPNILKKIGVLFGGTCQTLLANMEGNNCGVNHFYSNLLCIHF